MILCIPRVLILTAIDNFFKIEAICNKNNFCHKQNAYCIAALNQISL